MNLNSRELATVLAALRHFQKINDKAASYPCHFAFEGVTPLTDNQIDSLCERINTKPLTKITRR